MGNKDLFVRLFVSRSLANLNLYTKNVSIAISRGILLLRYKATGLE